MIPPPLSRVQAGDVKTLRLTANFKGSAKRASVDVTLVAEGSPLQALLQGPSGSIQGSRTIVLNASKSNDPDDPTSNTPFSITWECARADYPAPCFAGTDYGEQSGLVWKLKASLLAPNLLHTFKVTVSKGSRSASAFVALTPLPTASKVPTGRITRQCSGSACPKRHNADAPLALTLAPDAGFESATVSWQSDQLADVALGTSADLSIPPAKLPATGALVVNAVLKLATGEQSITQISVPTNGKPSCSLAKCLTVTTMSDTFPGATFGLQAAGFLDDQDDLRCAWCLHAVRAGFVVCGACPAALVFHAAAQCNQHALGHFAVPFVMCALLFFFCVVLRYEFGKVTADGRREVMASGKDPSTTLTGLSLDTAGVYVCTVDSDGAKVCVAAVRTVEGVALTAGVSSLRWLCGPVWVVLSGFTPSLTRAEQIQRPGK